MRSRVKARNWGDSKHASKFASWKLVAYMGFGDERATKEFVWHLETGSGRALLGKHFFIKVFFYENYALMIQSEWTTV